jgi:predicted Fe-Mo cluster-binding NifX family protein
VGRCVEFAITDVDSGCTRSVDGTDAGSCGAQAPANKSIVDQLVKESVKGLSKGIWQGGRFPAR